jgi:DNA-directed RNA polymerase specialized sigma24 family protein
MPAGAASGASIGGGVGAPVGADAAGGGTAHRAIELAARTSYGRLVAVLAARSRDVAAAEDALGDAFAAALAQWPEVGVPASPEGWLVAAARRRLADGRRRTAVREAAADEIAYAASFLARDAASVGASDPFPDRRLGLLFACAHPAVDPGVRTPLMLQVVLGLDAREIASAFLESPAATAQRLVRAKRKLRDAGVPFAVPEREELAPRLTAVLEAIYAAFGAGWDAVVGGDPGGGDDARGREPPPARPIPADGMSAAAAADGSMRAAHRADLADEAIWLGRLVVDALPEEPEPRGLLALMLYCHARRDGAHGPGRRVRPARRTGSGALVAPAHRRGRVGAGRRGAPASARALPARGGHPVGAPRAGVRASARLGGGRRALRCPPRLRADRGRARQPGGRARRGGGARGGARRGRRRAGGPRPRLPAVVGAPGAPAGPARARRRRARRVRARCRAHAGPGCARVPARPARPAGPGRTGWQWRPGIV